MAECSGAAHGSGQRPEGPPLRDDQSEEEYYCYWPPESPDPDTELGWLQVSEVALRQTRQCDNLQEELRAYQLRSAQAEARLLEREAAEEHLEHEVSQLDVDCRELQGRFEECEEKLNRAAAELTQALIETAEVSSQCENIFRSCAVAERGRAHAEAKLEALKKRLHERDDELRALKRSRPVVATEVAWASLQHLPRPVGQSTESTLRPLRAEEPVFCLLSELIHRTCTQHRRDLGSQDFCPAPQLCIKRVEFVANPRLMRQYHARAEEIAERRPAGCTPIVPLSHLKVPADPRTLAPDLNVHLLFHGSRPEAVDDICTYGFDPRRGGEHAGKLFGVATYLAANASKADTYTDLHLHRDSQARLPRNAERKLIVARALLGESWRATQARQRDLRPPDGPDRQPLDSAWADTRNCGGTVDHVEVMLYDRGQAYPEYVVSYCHVGGCACAECCKRPGV